MKFDIECARYNFEYNCKHVNYIRALKFLNLYFFLGGTMDAEILYYYIKALANLNRTPEALENIKILSENYEESYSEFEITYLKAIIYMLADDFATAEELMQKIDGDTNEKRYYFDFGKIYMYEGKYELAKEYFTRCINTDGNIGLNILSKNNIEKKDRYVNDGTFIEISYNTFKQDGSKLQPGHIVYANAVQNIDSRIDSKLYEGYKIPYLIWKVDGDNYYCFPVTTKTTTRYAYILKANDYPNCNLDRTIKDRLVVIKESDIKQVTDKVSEKDCKGLFSFMYSKMYISYRHSQISEEIIFLREMLQNFDIQSYDVLVFFDAEQKKGTNYIIIDEDDENYFTYEIIGNDIIKNYTLVKIPKSEIMFRVLKLSDEQKEKIIKQLSNNYQKRKDIKQ